MTSQSVMLPEVTAVRLYQQVLCEKRGYEEMLSPVS